MRACILPHLASMIQLRDSPVLLYNTRVVPEQYCAGVCACASSYWASECKPLRMHNDSKQPTYACFAVTRQPNGHAFNTVSFIDNFAEFRRFFLFIGFITQSSR